MSERPFMQLYVSDYLGDTRHLSCEQHGAYLLLLMTMWNAGGSLPDDDAKLSRVVCLSLKKWRAIRTDLEPFFIIGEGLWTSNRLTEELRKSESKSQSRASAGEIGGRAKALKDKQRAVANATALPQHLPDTIKNTSSLRSEAARKRAARLPEDWHLPDEWQQDALDAGLRHDRIPVEAAKMRDWSRSAPAGAKLDWRAAWRNWCRKAASDAPLPRGSPHQSVPSYPNCLQWQENASPMNDQQRISQALDKLFRTYRSFDQGETAAEVLRNRTEKAKVYFEAVSSYQAVDIEQAVSNFLAGSAPGHNPAYAPAAPLVGAECRRVMNLRLDSEHRARPMLPEPTVQLSPDERERMAALAERTVRSLRTPDRQAELEEEQRRHQGWGRTNARFQPDMSPDVVRKRLGFTVGDPDGDTDAA